MVTTTQCPTSEKRITVVVDPLRMRSGFTLVEVLVVLVIIGVVTASALLSFGLLGINDNLNRDSRRLVALVELASDEATIQGRDLGIEVLRGGYRFVEFDPLIDRWYEIIGDDILRARQLDEGTEFELWIEEKKIELFTQAQQLDTGNDDADKDRRNDRDTKDDYLPHIMILSSGDVSPFELRMVRHADRAEVTVRMSLAGELEILQGDEDAR